MDNKNKKGQKQGGKAMLYQYHCACCETVVASTEIKTVQTVDHIIFEVLLDFGFSVLLHVSQQRLSLNLYKSIWLTETANPLL